MRAGPLSNSEVIQRLNSSYIPVYTVNEDYAKKGPAPEEEKKEREKIFKQGYAAKKSVGTVHVYILNPEGDLIDSVHVAEAAKSGQLLRVLTRNAEELKIEPGKIVVPPRPQAERSVSNNDLFTLHLTSRSIDGRGAWGEFPVENWIVLSSEEVKKLLPVKKARAGDIWEVDAGVSQKILTHFYPATENNDVSKNQFEKQRLTGKVVGNVKGVIQTRLEGEVQMRHSFYHKEDGNKVDAHVIGYLDFDSKTGQVLSLKLVTDKATYGGGQFAVAVRSVR